MWKSIILDLNQNSVNNPVPVTCVPVTCVPVTCVPVTCGRFLFKRSMVLIRGFLSGLCFSTSSAVMMTSIIKCI